jgi:hypothetical protein
MGKNPYSFSTNSVFFHPESSILMVVFRNVDSLIYQSVY